MVSITSDFVTYSYKITGVYCLRERKRTIYLVPRNPYHINMVWVSEYYFLIARFELFSLVDLY